MYEFLSNLTLVIHLIFILFVIFGGLLFFWKPKIIYIHLPAFIWGSYVEFTNTVCPLTYLENWFLKLSNASTYSNNFIQNYLIQIIYPTNLTSDIQIFLGSTLIFINLIIYGLIIKKNQISKN